MARTSNPTTGDHTESSSPPDEAHSPNPRSSKLLQLPTELRLHIYSFMTLYPLSSDSILWFGAYYSCRTLHSEMHAFLQSIPPSQLIADEEISDSDSDDYTLAAAIDSDTDTDSYTEPTQEPLYNSIVGLYINDTLVKNLYLAAITPTLNAFNLISSITVHLQIPLSNFKIEWDPLRLPPRLYHRTWLHPQTPLSFLLRTWAKPPVHHFLTPLLGLYIDHVHFTLLSGQHWREPWSGFEGDMADGLVMPFILHRAVHVNVVTVTLKVPEETWVESRALDPVEKVKVVDWRRRLCVEFTVTETVGKEGGVIQKRFAAKRRGFEAVGWGEWMGRRVRRGLFSKRSVG